MKRVWDRWSLGLRQNLKTNLIKKLYFVGFGTMSGGDEDGIWTFGFGSNMDQDYMKSAKGLTVLDSSPAILKGYRLGFNVIAFPLFEPAMANIKNSENDEVHGVANKLSYEEAETLKRMEGIYKPTYTEFLAYDGRKLKGFFFDSNPERLASYEEPPSKRYLNILISGAKKAGLNQDYIKKLESLPTYVPSAEVLAKRETWPIPDELPLFTVEDLAAKSDFHGRGPVLTGCLGYVVERYQNRWLPPCGRDITSWSMCRLNGVETKTHDGGGRPPFPFVPSMREDELEYARQLLDHLTRDDPVVRGRIVGFLKEFKEQQSRPAEEGFKIIDD